MPLTRRAALASLAATALAPKAALAQEADWRGMYFDILSDEPALYRPALARIAQRGKPDMAAALIQTMRFAPNAQEEMRATLRKITGADAGDNWFEWMLWQEANPQIKPHPAFIEYKRELMLRIDPNFADFLKPADIQPDKMKIRLEEITWGGVRKDGIPSLDNPALIAASEARYMRGDDLVFGVSINGDTRAYPLRIMGWHEMFNEVIGGVPVALAYCTLCGSGILFETKLAGRSRPLVFGSSGFLYRSNKLMFDRATNSLWNQFTGQPVVGKLVGSGITLKQRPVVITTWDAWKSRNPGTKILSLNTGFRRDYGSGVVYNDYFSSSELMFPARVDQRQHRQKDYVFGIRQFGGAKAWPLKSFKGGRVLNDGLGQTKLVLIGDDRARSVRAYERGALTFKVQGGQLTSNDGRIWQATEEGLVSGTTTLPRVAGHVAYWFAWDSYLGNRSEIYKG